MTISCQRNVSTTLLNLLCVAELVRQQLTQDLRWKAKTRKGCGAAVFCYLPLVSTSGEAFVPLRTGSKHQNHKTSQVPPKDTELYFFPF